MRLSLWLLLVAGTLVALSWLVLVVASGFAIWTSEANGLGLTLQAGLLLSPVALFIGLRVSKHSAVLSTALFMLSWLIAFAAIVTLFLW